MKPPTTARRAPFALLVAGLLLGGMALLLALNTVSAAQELRRSDVIQRNADVAARVVQLSAQVQASAAPAALARAAGRLGMVPNPNPAFLSQAPDGSVRVLGSALPASPPAIPPAAAPAGVQPPPTVAAHASTTPTTGTPTPTPTPAPAAAAAPAPAGALSAVPVPATILPGGPR